MSEEQNQEITSPAAPNNAELDALKNSIQALEKKNYELIGKLKEAKTVPDGVDAVSYTHLTLPTTPYV